MINYFAAEAPASSNNGWQVAVIGALALVLSAIIPVFISRREHRQSPLIPPGYADLEKELHRQITDLIADNAKKTNRIRNLEAYLWRNGIDPSNGRKAIVNE